MAPQIRHLHPRETTGNLSARWYSSAPFIERRDFLSSRSEISLLLVALPRTRPISSSLLYRLLPLISSRPCVPVSTYISSWERSSSAGVP